MTEKTAKQCLQVVYALQQEGAVRGVYVAREMDISKPTASVALRQLVDDGYLIREEDRSFKLTERGAELAKIAINETITRGRSYHGLMGGTEADALPDLADSDEQKLQWLQQENAWAFLEAMYILGRRFYYIRLVDVGHFLRQNMAELKRKLNRLELQQFVMVGEHDALSLTESGLAFGKRFYEAHEAARARMVEAGISVETAEAEACRQGASKFPL